jgi:phosphonopyruvate decarboxylase
MISACSFVDQLRGLGYSQYAGVPCSFLTSLINYVIDDPALDYIGATSEGEAVGITFGAFLAGRKTVTMCQNSGLGNMVNPLTSLNYPFRVPTLLIVTWRGQPEVKDEPQHEQMGRIVHRLLETLEIPCLPFPRSEAEIAKTMEQDEASMEKRKRPFALVMQKGSVAPHALSGRLESELIKTDLRENLSAKENERPTRTAAIELILDALAGDEAIIASTGKTGRELFTISDRANHLYVVGGMGTGVGDCLGGTRAPRQPVARSMNGAALMKLGVFATIGLYQPSNLLHIVLDNEAHDSTGGQQTASGIVRFAAIAAAANYHSAFAVDRPEKIREAVRLLRHRPGPSLLHVKIQPGSPGKLGRPTVQPHEVKERFSRFLSSNAK